MTEIASSVEQAAATALRAFLSGWAGLAGVVITDKWPAPEKPLLNKSISVLLVGRREEWPVHQRVVSQVNDASPATTGTYRWRVAAIKQGIQLDVWTLYPAVRDQLLAELDKALHAGVEATLGSGYSGPPFRDGPLLALDAATGHEGFADFTFDGPQVVDAPGTVRVEEFRATLTGNVSVELELTAASPRMLELTLREHIDGAVTDDDFTISGASDFTHTEV